MPSCHSFQPLNIPIPSVHGDLSQEIYCTLGYCIPRLVRLRVRLHYAAPIVPSSANNNAALDHLMYCTSHNNPCNKINCTAPLQQHAMPHYSPPPTTSERGKSCQEICGPPACLRGRHPSLKALRSKYSMPSSDTMS